MNHDYFIIDPSEIGPEQWNQLTEVNHINFPYMQYGYISRSSRDKWKILTDDARTFFIPLPLSRTWGLQQVITPPFLQRVFILYTEDQRNPENLIPALRFLAKKYNKINLNLDHSWNRLPSGYDKIKRRNYYHQYGQPVILNHHHQRNMRKAKVEHYSLDWEGDQDELMKGYIKYTLSRRGRHKKKLRIIASDLVHWASAQGILRVACARDRRGKAVAGIGLLLWKKRLINLLPFTSQEGWDGRAMYFLLLHLLKENPYQAEIFDFEGSEIPGVARFYKGFGPSKEHFHGLHFEKHPWLLDILNAATKWFK